MFDVVSDYFQQLADPFINPANRVFIGHMIAALGIALAFQIFIARQTLRLALCKLFAREIWLSPSARADYALLVINQLIMMGAAPRLITNLAFATFLFGNLHLLMDGRPQLLAETPPWAIAIAFTTVLFLVDDASKYLVHRAMHRWEFLWAFHEVHHSAETLTPLTVYRTHPVEGVLFALRSALSQGLVMALFVFFFGAKVELVAVLGANVFLFFFNLAGANLRHSHVWISYGPLLEKWLISPAQHQIHHSIETRHYDRNFGAALAIWDRIGGSLHLAKGEKPVAFGLIDGAERPHGLRQLYWTPIQKSARALARALPRRIRQMPQLAFRFPMRALLGALLLGAALLLAVGQSARAAELNIYSHRQPYLIEPFLKAYTEKTGTKVNMVYATKGLAQRLQAEGENSPADLVLTVDIARLYAYVDKDLLAPVDSEILKSRIPAHLRDPQNRWFAFSKRSRVFAVAKAAKDGDQLKRYEDLTDPRWRGRICSRPGSHVYNRALVASMILAHGAEATEDWAAGVVDNLARRPQGDDRAQIKAIVQGVCDIAIVNNYYIGKLKISETPEHHEWAKAINLVFPNQQDRGAHVNISGGGVTKHAPNREEAVRFLEFLTSPEAQTLYSEINFEYPVVEDAPLTGALKEWGPFKEDTVSISDIARLAAEAQMVIDRVGW